MQPYELLAACYFGGLCAAAVAAPVRWRRRLASALVSAAVAALAVTAASVASASVRAWLPHAYLVLGYWVPGMLASRERHPWFETWLQRTDARLLRVALLQPSGRARQYLELTYLLCYPLVPVSFIFVMVGGGPEDVSRYWVAVLLAGFACYVSLPWLTARPPRLVAEGTEPARGLAAVNALVLGRVSHQLATFPSGHVAVSVAAAAAVGAVSATAGVVFGILAASIGVAAVSGRYHYVIDVLLGAALGGAAWWTATVW